MSFLCTGINNIKHYLKKDGLEYCRWKLIKPQAEAAKIETAGQCVLNTPPMPDTDMYRGVNNNTPPRLKQEFLTVSRFVFFCKKNQNVKMTITFRTRNIFCSNFEDHS